MFFPKHCSWHKTYSHILQWAFPAKNMQHKDKSRVMLILSPSIENSEKTQKLLSHCIFSKNFPSKDIYFIFIMFNCICLLNFALFSHLKKIILLSKTLMLRNTIGNWLPLQSVWQLTEGKTMLSIGPMEIIHCSNFISIIKQRNNDGKAITNWRFA